MDIYGEKYSGDSKFVADCRQLQAMYRVEVNEAIRPYKGKMVRLIIMGTTYLAVKSQGRIS